MSSPEQRLADLLERLQEARTRLEAAVDDPETALAVLGEVNELAKEAAVEVDRAREAIRDDDRRG